MGEEIELTDVSGNKVMVSLHHVIQTIAKLYIGRRQRVSCESSGGKWIKITVSDEG